MAKIFTEHKDMIAGGIIYRADKAGFVDVPDDVAEAEGLAMVVRLKPAKQNPGVKFLSGEE